MRSVQKSTPHSSNSAVQNVRRKTDGDDTAPIMWANPAVGTYDVQLIQFGKDFALR